MRDYNEWEAQESERQKQAVKEALAKMNQKRPRTFKVPRWLVIVGAILLGFGLSYAFIYLSFSQKG